MDADQLVANGFFKTKRDARGQVERYKARLVAKVSVKEKALITLKPTLLFLPKTLFVLSWH